MTLGNKKFCEKSWADFCISFYYYVRREVTDSGSLKLYLANLENVLIILLSIIIIHNTVYLI